MTEGAPFGVRQAREWTARAPRRWHRPWVAAVAWALCVGITMAVEDNPPCTDARPCTGGDLEGALAVGLAVAAVAGALASPRVGAVAAVLLALLGLRFDAVGAGVVVAVAAFALAAATSVVTVWLTERRRRAQLAYVDRVAGTYRMVLPRDATAALRSRAALLLGLAGLLVLLTAGSGWWAAGRVRTERARERAAPVVTALVVGHTEDGDVELVADGRKTSYVVYQADHYPVGLTLDAYLVGTELRPVREPYDATLPALAPATALALAAVAAGAAGARLGSARRLARDVPALRMRSFVGWSDEVPVIPLGSEWPLLMAKVAFTSGADPVEEYGVRADPDDEQARLQPAVAVGEIASGGHVGVYVGGELFAPTGRARPVEEDYLLAASVGAGDDGDDYGAGDGFAESDADGGPEGSGRP